MGLNYYVEREVDGKTAILRISEHYREWSGCFCLLEERPEFYFFTDDWCDTLYSAGYQVLYGCPWSAIGVVQAECRTIREVRAFLKQHGTPGESFYRRYLHRRHGRDRTVLFRA